MYQVSARPRPLCSLLAPRLVPSGLGCAVDTPLQTSEWHADARGLAALASRGLARQRGPAFASGINSKTSRMLWCRDVSRRRRPLLLPSVFPFEIDQTAHQIRFAISVSFLLLYILRPFSFDRTFLYPLLVVFYNCLYVYYHIYLVLSSSAWPYWRRSVFNRL